MRKEKQIAFWVAGLAVAMAILYVLSSVLLPFVAGLAIAYFFDPLADRLERLGISRALSTSVILLSFFVIVGAIGMVLFPLLQAQVVGLIGRLPDMINTFHASLQQYISRLEHVLPVGQMARIQTFLQGYTGDAMNWLSGLLPQVWAGGKAIVNLLSLMVVMPMVAFFLLRDWDHIIAMLDSLLPRASADTIRQQIREIDKTIAGFVRGQAMVCASLGVIYGIGLSLVGLEFGLLIGLGTGVLTFVPYVGMMTGAVIALSVALVQFSNPIDFLLVIGVFAFGQTIDIMFLTPNFVAGRVNLHPVWVIFSLMAGGAIFGFTGVLLGVPVAGAIGVLVRFAISKYRSSPLYLQGDVAASTGARPAGSTPTEKS